MIIQQGDHGFSADLLPGSGSPEIYPTLSPVNTFRLVFDAYFGGTYGLLADHPAHPGVQGSVPLAKNITPGGNQHE